MENLSSMITSFDASRNGGPRISQAFAADIIKELRKSKVKIENQVVLKVCIMHTLLMLSLRD